MDANLTKMVQMARAQFRAPNPPSSIPPDPGTALQLMLVDSGLKDQYTYESLKEAALAAGVASEEIGDWMEGLASWL